MIKPMLSPHLSLEEAYRSDIAARAGIDNRPSNGALIQLELLAQTVFEPLRAEFGPLIVTSGYRSPALNALVPGSSTTSAHVFGCALDLKPTAPGIKLSSVILWLRGSSVPFDQAIYEYAAWVHVGIKKPRHTTPRRQCLMKFAGAGYQAFDPRIAIR